MTAKKDTKFKPGQSGNPGGRPAGAGWVGAARRELEKAWDGVEKNGVDGIRHKLIELAKTGDMGAIRLVAERVCPPIKAMEPAAPIALPEGSLIEKAGAVLQALAAGDLNTGQASQVLQALGAVAKVQEVHDLERRIQALEESKDGK